MGTPGRAIYAVGCWITETGQALDRLGSRLQGNYSFQEQRIMSSCNNMILGFGFGNLKLNSKMSGIRGGIGGGSRIVASAAAVAYNGGGGYDAEFVLSEVLVSLYKTLDQFNMLRKFLDFMIVDLSNPSTSDIYNYHFAITLDNILDRFSECLNYLTYSKVMIEEVIEQLVPSNVCFFHSIVCLKESRSRIFGTCNQVASVLQHCKSKLTELNVAEYREMTIRGAAIALR